MEEGGGGRRGQEKVSFSRINTGCSVPSDGFVLAGIKAESCENEESRSGAIGPEDPGN